MKTKFLRDGSKDTMLVVKASLRCRVKSRAAIEGKSLRGLVEEILVAYLKKSEASNELSPSR